MDRTQSRPAAQRQPSPSPSTPTRSNVVRSGLVVVLALTVLSGCGLADLASHTKEEHYGTRAEAPTQGDLAFVLPDFVPEDATDITVRVDTKNPAAKMYDWASASGRLPDDCDPAGVADTAAPFDPDSWPDHVLAAPGQVCGPRPIHIRSVDQRFYGW